MYLEKSDQQRTHGTGLVYAARAQLVALVPFHSGMELSPTKNGDLLPDPVQLSLPPASCLVFTGRYHHKETKSSSSILQRCEYIICEHVFISVGRNQARQPTPCIQFV